MTDVADLLDAYRPGHALARGFYCDQAIFARDMALLLGRWNCVGHASELPRPGDYLVAELGDDSAIVVRGGDGVLRAFANVCRHRGSRLCGGTHGHAALLTCPYHAWSYRLDGQLAVARHMPAGFAAEAYALVALALAEIGGLLFVSHAAEPPGIEVAAAALAGMTGHFGWETARIACRRSYAVEANWKLVLENYHECYHCGPAHPEFSALHGLARPEGRQLTAADVEHWAPAPDGLEPARVMQSWMADGCLTGSQDGRAVAPLMGHAGYDGGCVFAEIGFLSAFLAYPDYGVMYRFLPVGVQLTRMEVLWLVRGDAEAGRDFSTDAVSWLWDVTSLADKRIIERNQAGVRSMHYRPGPFSMMEEATRMYVARYVAELAAAEGGMQG